MIRSFFLASTLFASAGLYAADAAQAGPRDYSIPPAFIPKNLRVSSEGAVVVCPSPTSDAGETPMGAPGTSASFAGQSPSNGGQSPFQVQEHLLRASPMQALPVVATAGAEVASSAPRHVHFSQDALKASHLVEQARHEKVAFYVKVFDLVPECLVCPIENKIFFTEFYLEPQDPKYFSPAYSPTHTPTARKQDVRFPQAVAVAMVQQTLNDVVQAETAQQNTSRLARATHPARGNKVLDARRDLVRELELLQNDYIPGIAYCPITQQLFDTETFETVAPADRHMSLTKK